MNEYEECVKVLLAKSTDAHDSGDAMRFAQAAANAANALCALATAKKEWPDAG